MCMNQLIYESLCLFQPMRVCILGPPAVGKTTICSELAKQYKLHHIKIKDVIDEAMAKLQASADRADKGDEEDDDGRGG